MSDKPILFSGPMVRALIAGTKTQTRRIAKPQPPKECGINYMLGNESWLPVVQRTPVRRLFEAWGGDLYAQKPQNHLCGLFEIVPRIQPGDRLYVRETWTHTGTGVWTIADTHMARDGAVAYQADGVIPGGKYWPSIHMPRRYSRITLTVTDVRVERLQDISEADAIAEGIEYEMQTAAGRFYHNYQNPPCPIMAYGSYRSLWETINGPGSWDANPWVAAYSFSVAMGNIDQLARAA